MYLPVYLISYFKLYVRINQLHTIIKKIKSTIKIKLYMTSIIKADFNFEHFIIYYKFVFGYLGILSTEKTNALFSIINKMRKKNEEVYYVDLQPPTMADVDNQVKAEDYPIFMVRAKYFINILKNKMQHHRGRYRQNREAENKKISHRQFPAYIENIGGCMPQIG